MNPISISPSESFVNALSQLSPNLNGNYLGKQEHKISSSERVLFYKVSITKENSLSKDEIAATAKQALSFLKATSTRSLCDRVRLLTSLERGLQTYAARVEKSAKGRWWVRLLSHINIHSIFGIPLAHKPYDIVQLQHDARETINALTPLSWQPGEAEALEKDRQEYVRRQKFETDRNRPEEELIEEQLGSIIKSYETDKASLAEIASLSETCLNRMLVDSSSHFSELLFKLGLHYRSQTTQGKALRQKIILLQNELTIAALTRLEQLCPEKFQCLRSDNERCLQAMKDVSLKIEELNKELSRLKGTPHVTEVPTVKKLGNELRQLSIRLRAHRLCTPSAADLADGAFLKYPAAVMMKALAMGLLCAIDPLLSDFPDSSSGENVGGQGLPGFPQSLSEISDFMHLNFDWDEIIKNASENEFLPEIANRVMLAVKGRRPELIFNLNAFPEDVKEFRTAMKKVFLAIHPDKHIKNEKHVKAATSLFEIAKKASEWILWNQYGQR